VIDNFSAGSHDRLGLGADRLHEHNPRLVAVSMSGFGATGPWRDYVSYADAIGALCGFTSLCTDGGHPERLAPVVHGLADIVAGHHAALATLAALAQRRRTGRGCVVDLAQLEAMAVQTGPALLARTATGAQPTRRSSSTLLAAPEGVYPCLGPDRWVAITVLDDRAWRALCAVIGRSDLAAVAPVERRAERASAIDAAIAAWTAPRPATLVAECLQAAGVAAGMVQDGRDLVEHDPQLRARGFYPVVEHPRAGAFVHEGVPIRLSATPGAVWDAAPLLGADTEWVLRELGGFTDAEIQDLRACGALE
jgi:crotonobetainyl-CoA:carnitine CoA-transferase CaiB-like acyl-CoA transferase